MGGDGKIYHKIFRKPLFAFEKKKKNKTEFG
jgi:hypothetical protein